MKKIQNKKIGCIIITCLVMFGVVLGVFIRKSFNTSAEHNIVTAKERLQEKRNETQADYFNSKIDSGLNEKVRIIIELEDDSVAELVSKDIDIANYTSKLKGKENKVIRNQKDIIDDVEKLTENKVVSQSGYLVNSFSIDAKRSDIKKIANMDGVKKVYEATIYETCMETAIDEGNVTAQLESLEYGYTGEGVIIAIIDTGVNYKHQDMKLDEGINTKYTKEEWKKKIELLGYGKYMSDKVPFGYDYTTGLDECLNKQLYHGYHVASIAAGNGKINGVARNAQILGLNVFGKGRGVTSDIIVESIEDAVKLGADIINMSLGSDKPIVNDEDYIQIAVENATKEGVICCISAGNSGTSSGLGGSENFMNMKDTALISSPAVTHSSLAVASANNIVTSIEEDKKLEADNTATYNTKKDINMSSFSSWGPTNELNIKPEITAPGGGIKAALTGVDEYEIYSGTSMSSPYVAGSEAIMLNAIQASGLELRGEKLVQFMKNSLMNTADVIIDETVNAPYSVRYQGAGMVDVYGAVDNHVIVTCKDMAKVELGQIEGTTTFDLEFVNYGKELCTYNLNNSQIYIDFTVNKENQEEIKGQYGIKPVEGAYISYNVNKVEVPARGSVTVSATVNIPQDYEKNSFVEAFIKLEGEGVQDLGLPVLGFYGKWDNEPIMDKSLYIEGESMLDKAIHHNPFSGGSCLVTINDRATEILGLEWEKVLQKNSYVLVPKYKGDLVAFSPNGDEMRDIVFPKIAMYRCAKELSVKVLDEDMKTIRTLISKNSENKLQYKYMNQDNANTFISDYSKDNIVGWDGKVYNKEKGEYEYVQSGQYYIQVEAKINKDANPQTITMPVKIDNKQPQIDVFNINKIKGDTVVEFNVIDDVAVSGSYYLDINNNNNIYTYSKRFAETSVNEAGNYVVNLGKLENAKISFMTEDMAGNQVFKTSLVKEDSENDIDIDFTEERYFNLCQGIYISPVLEENATYSSLDGSLLFEGECEKDINITINGVEAKYSTNTILNKFKEGEGKHYCIELPPVEKDKYEQTLNVEVTQLGKIIFNKVYKVNVDTQRLAVDMIKNDDMIEVKTFIEEYTSLILLNDVKDKSFKLQFKATGYTLNDDMDNFLYICPRTEDDTILEHKVTYEGDGIYNVEIENMEEVVCIETHINTYSGNEDFREFIFVTNRDDYVSYVNEYELEIYTNIHDFCNLNKSKINTDGTITIKGKTLVMPERILVNGQKVEVNSESFEFSYNMPVKNGKNFINIEALINNQLVTRTSMCVMDDVQLEFDALINAVDGVIDTNKEIFNLEGNIKSYSNVVSIDINGDNLYTASDNYISKEDIILKKFDYKLKLNEGMNKIVVDVKTYSGEMIKKVLMINYVNK